MIVMSPLKKSSEATEFKERLLLASTEGSDPYGSVTTGLFSEHIQFQLKTYLDDQRITDETLSDGMSGTAGIELERQTEKRKTTSRT